MKKKSLINIPIIVIVTILIIMLSSCMSSEKVMEYSQNGSYDKLQQYVNKNITGYNNNELVNLAIIELAKSNEPANISFLETQFFSAFEELDFYDKDDNIVETSSSYQIIKAMNDNGIAFTDVKTFINYLTQKYEAASYSESGIKSFNASVITKEIIAMATRIDSKKVYSNFGQELKDRISNEYFEDAKNICQLGKLLCSDDYYFDELHSNLTDLVNSQDNIDSIKNDLDYYSSIYDLNYENAFVLRAYIAQGFGSNKYEIIMPNGSHSVLYTTSTVFSSTGNFAMDVIPSGTENVVLNDGFNQVWNTYKEVTADELNEMSAIGLKYSTIKQSYEMNENSIKRSLENINTAISKLIMGNI